MQIDHLYYNGLSDQEKRVYDILVRGIRTRQRVIKTPIKQASSLDKLIQALRFEHPEFYYVDFYESRVGRTALFEEYHIAYRYTEEVIRKKDQLIETAVQSILRDTQNISEYRRELIIHDRIVRNVTYGEIEQAPHKAHSIEGVFLDRLAVCEGISKAFIFLCRKVGIPCAMLVGDLMIGSSYNENKYDRHAWNLASIEGQCYYVDVTNDNYRYGYLSHTFFNLSEQLIATTHRLPTDVRLPRCDYVYTPCPLINNWADVTAALKEGVKKKLAAVEMRVSRRFLPVSEVKKQLTEHLGHAYHQSIIRYIDGFICEEKAHVFTVLFKYHV